MQIVAAPVQALSVDQLLNWYKGNDIWAMVLLTQEVLEIHTKPASDMQAVLDQYQDVFEDPKSLPPSTTYDHAIPLLPGAVPVNSKPYRYSP